MAKSNSTFSNWHSLLWRWETESSVSCFLECCLCMILGKRHWTMSCSERAITGWRWETKRVSLVHRDSSYSSQSESDSESSCLFDSNVRDVFESRVLRIFLSWTASLSPQDFFSNTRAISCMPFWRVWWENHRLLLHPLSSGCELIRKEHEGMCLKREWNLKDNWALKLNPLFRLNFWEIMFAWLCLSFPREFPSSRTSFLSWLLTW